jgi:fructose-1,6-bisphosphatase/inositol monophosphatase family enzyme
MALDSAFPRRATDDALLVTGFPYDVHQQTPTCRAVGAFSARRGVRRLGSAALDLCYVAAGGSTASGSSI